MQRVCRLNPHRFPGGEINAEQNYYPQQQHGRHKTKQKTYPNAGSINVCTVRSAICIFAQTKTAGMAAETKRRMPSST